MQPQNKPNTKPTIISNAYNPPQKIKKTAPTANLNLSKSVNDPKNAKSHLQSSTQTKKNNLSESQRSQKSNKEPQVNPKSKKGKYKISRGNRNNRGVLPPGQSMKDYLFKKNNYEINFEPNPSVLKERDHYTQEQTYSNRIFEMRMGTQENESFSKGGFQTFQKSHSNSFKGLIMGGDDDYTGTFDKGVLNQFKKNNRHYNIFDLTRKH